MNGREATLHDWNRKGGARSIRKIQMAGIENLGLTQIYLSAEKQRSVAGWFTGDVSCFDAMPVYDFMHDGRLYLLDGHTRAFTAYQNGLRQVPVIYDASITEDVVTERLYRLCIRWCVQWGLRHAGDLTGRILPADAYESLWIGRCAKAQRLLQALQTGALPQAAYQQRQAALLRQGLTVYGLSADFHTLYCEDAAGMLYERGM